jgi:outer membrane protein OmpA-like peptidoglycan-associated protein
MIARVVVVALTATLLIAGPAEAQSGTAASRPAPRHVTYVPRTAVYTPRTVRYTPRTEDERPHRSAPKTVTVGSDILFAFNSSALGSQAAPVLAGVIRLLERGPAGRVVITGYTDSVGTPAYNLGLSQRRATAVMLRLEATVHRRGLTFVATGKGEADPVAPNTLPGGADNPAGRARNRRVTVAVP